MLLDVIAAGVSSSGWKRPELLPGALAQACAEHGHIPAIDDGTATVPGLLQAHLPDSRVVRAFSMIDAADMSGDGHPAGDPRRRALALAGDDPAAKQLVAGLYDQFGFDTVDLGGLAESWRVDPGQPAFVTRQNLAELQANVAKAERPA